MNNFKELKTIVIEADTYFDALHQANSMFNSKNVISVEEIDKPKITHDYAVNQHDDSWDWLAVD
jgi:hypothetical protein